MKMALTENQGDAKIKSKEEADVDLVMDTSASRSAD